MGPIGCPEIFDTNYQTMQQNIPEERRNKPEVISLEERINLNRVHLMYTGGSISVIKQTDTYITSNAADNIYHTV
jgi:hypothetical protein